MTGQPIPQPSQSPPERRAPLRLLAYWEKLRKDRPMPSERDLVPDDIQDLWDNCFIIPVKDIKTPHYRYSYMGKNVVEAYRGTLGDNGQVESIAPPTGMIDGYMTVRKTRKPLIESGEFTNLQNQPVKYRQCLLPLGEGKEVQAIFGALHIRVFPAG